MSPPTRRLPGRHRPTGHAVSASTTRRPRLRPRGRTRVPRNNETESGESDAGRCAKEVEREKGGRLNITPRGAAANDGDRDRRNNQPERRQNLNDESGGARRHERREHDERDAENRDGFASAWHVVSDRHHSTSLNSGRSVCVGRTALSRVPYNRGRPMTTRGPMHRVSRARDALADARLLRPVATARTAVHHPALRRARWDAPRRHPDLGRQELLVLRRGRGPAAVRPAEFPLLRPSVDRLRLALGSQSVCVAVARVVDGGDQRRPRRGVDRRLRCARSRALSRKIRLSSTRS